MEEQLTGNVLVAQSGGPTAVINSSLAGNPVDPDGQGFRWKQTIQAFRYV